MSYSCLRLRQTKVNNDLGNPKLSESIAELLSSEFGYFAVNLFNAGKTGEIRALGYLLSEAQMQGRRTMHSKTYFARNYFDGEVVVLTALRGDLLSRIWNLPKFFNNDSEFSLNKVMEDNSTVTKTRNLCQD